jgi:hypothetical protein
LPTAETSRPTDARDQRLHADLEVSALAAGIDAQRRVTGGVGDLLRDRALEPASDRAAAAVDGEQDLAGEVVGVEVDADQLGDRQVGGDQAGDAEVGLLIIGRERERLELHAGQPGGGVVDLQMSDEALPREVTRGQPQPADERLAGGLEEVDVVDLDLVDAEVDRQVGRDGLALGLGRARDRQVAEPGALDEVDLRVRQGEPVDRDPPVQQVPRVPAQRELARGDQDVALGVREVDVAEHEVVGEPALDATDADLAGDAAVVEAEPDVEREVQEARRVQQQDQHDEHHQQQRQKDPQRPAQRPSNDPSGASSSHDQNASPRPKCTAQMRSSAADWSVSLRRKPTSRRNTPIGLSKRTPGPTE